MTLLRPLLLIAALLFSQHAAMLHGLAHAEHDLVLVSQHDGTAPALALDHGDNICAAFGALAHAVGNDRAAQASAARAIDARFCHDQTIPAVTRIGFDSRAPPRSA